MRKYFASTIFLILIAFAGLCQVSSINPPVHLVTPPKSYHTGFYTAAYIDTALFYKYLDWELQSDSLKAHGITIKDSASVLMKYVVLKEGKISSAIPALNQDSTLGNYISKVLLEFPYPWVVATQNGRKVNSYFLLKLVFYKQN